MPAYMGGGDYIESSANNLELEFKEKEEIKEPEKMVCFEHWHLSPVKAKPPPPC